MAGCKYKNYFSIYNHLIYIYLSTSFHCFPTVVILYENIFVTLCIMLLDIFGFIDLSLADILDILMVAVIFYAVFRWIRGSSAMNIFLAILLLFVVRVVVGALNMRLMTSLMNVIFDVGILALLIIFQPEIRHLLIKLGGSSARWKILLKNFIGSKTKNVDDKTAVEIAEACKVMSMEKVGALIVFPGQNPLQQIIETGDVIDALVSRRLILNLFFKNSPLHDGAMIISGDRIVASRCTLPITERSDIPAHYGMRHKAAIGITEESDASVIVVSEETGTISFVNRGVIKTLESSYEIQNLLRENGIEEEEGK